MPNKLKLLLLCPLFGCSLFLGGFFPVCGDGLLHKSEGCDDGNQRSGDGCSERCQLEAICGDDSITPPEECDDRNLTDGDGCDSNCTVTACGNTIITQEEECDDGNNLNGDGCDSGCVDEFCGDGLVNNNPNEECDDGNSIDGDGCAADCQLEIPPGCGDGSIDAGEECDEGANNSQNPNATCRINCRQARCGDGVIDDLSSEECDDGNSIDGDGCDAICIVEVLCGNGAVEGLEQCDDDNLVNNDGCDADCKVTAVIQIAAGDSHSCALFRSGGVRCWGKGSNGRLGYANENDIGDNEPPKSAGDVNIGALVLQISAGKEHTCAILADRSVLCWGKNDKGQLGQGQGATGDIGDNETPSSLSPIDLGGQDAEQIATGDSHTCALTTPGDIFCWGEGSQGRLGYGNQNNIGDNETPGSQGPVNVGGAALQIAAGDAHTCAILQDNTLHCWGNNDSGQLGLGSAINIGDDEAPSLASAVVIEPGIAVLSLGSGFSCAFIDGGDIKCWGTNNVGQLGQGNNAAFSNDPGETPLSLIPIDFQSPPSAFTGDAGGEHACAVFDPGEVRCWGRGDAGRLGYGNQTTIGDDEPPGAAVVDVGGLVSQISAGGVHTCALLTNGRVRCWGSGANGRLGYGDASSIGDNDFPSTVGDVPLF